MLLDFIDKQEERASNKKKKNHHNEPVILSYSCNKNYSNSRETKINMKFQPSISYNKNNLYYEKKYSLILDKIKHIHNEKDEEKGKKMLY